MSNKKIVFKDDFSDYTIGDLSAPLGAAGEYHVIDDRKVGHWEQAVAHGGWKREPWKVVEEDGRRAMEQTLASERATPLLVAGDLHWSDYEFSARIRPLSFERPIGLAFRYRNCRCYYLLRLGRGEACLCKRDHEKLKELCSTPLEISSDDYTDVQVQCNGDELSASADGSRILAAADPRYRSGRIALWAEAPVRFTDIKVAMDPGKWKESRKRGRDLRVEIGRLREGYPGPELWRRIDTSGFGSDRNIRWGDLNGDGRLEMVIAQKLDSVDRGNYSMVSCLTALDLDGRVMWQIGEPNPGNTLATADLAFQIHDIDGDGRQEVVFTKDFRIWIVDGSTGEVKASAPTPRSGPSDRPGGRPFERIVGDSLYFCDLSGRGRAQDIILKDRYSQIWALDRRLKLKWTRACNTGHYPFAYDIDGDGREELMAGYSLLEPNGEVIWELDLGDHADAILVGGLCPGAEEPTVALAAGDEGFVLVDVEGEMLSHHRLGHVQKLSFANFLPGTGGLNFMTINFWGSPGLTAVLDCNGEIIETYEPVHYGSALTPVNWPGDGGELALLSGHPRQGGLIDGHGRRLVMLPDDGHPCLCSSAVDLTGDARDELVFWNQKEIWIYTQDRPSSMETDFRPRRNPLHNESNYKANYSFPDSD